jgi:hypothetical protein
METTKTLKDENPFDIAVRKYGHVLGVFWVLEDNELTEINQVFAADVDLKIRNEKVRLLEVGQVIYKRKKLARYRLAPRQGFFDVLIENQGTIEAAFDLVDLNKFDGFTEHLFEADELEILEAAAPRIKDSLGKYMPIATITEEDKSDGIGFMFVERNFIIR